jgi:putative ABC transport system substrate-binding protein
MRGRLCGKPTARDRRRLAPSDAKRREETAMFDPRRRDFITLLGGAAVAWPLAARGQQAAKLPTVGYLGTAAASAWAPWTAAFVQRLHELGWMDGRTIAIQYRWAEGRAERWAEFAAELARLKVDVIVTGGNAAVAAKQASSVIPIVFAMVDDPVAMGLIASLARPGGNLTGLSMQSADVAGKRLALLREVVPGLRRLAIMARWKWLRFRPGRARWVWTRPLSKSGKPKTLRPSSTR